jgi:GxxExxY protein
VGNDEAESFAQLRYPQTYAIIGAAMEVHRVLGPGFLEAVYRQALRIELAERKIPFRCEVELVINYKGTALDCKYKTDFMCFDEVLIECKAKSDLAGIDRAQTINYLKATGFRRALLLNFGGERLVYERVVLNY